MDSFLHVDAPEPHRAQARAALTAHPEIAALQGRNPWTALIALALVLGQLALAALAPSLGALSLAVAWLVGALANQALLAVIHECAHHLVFRRKPWNRALALVANLPLGAPMAIEYAHFHLRHHREQGVMAGDADLPSPREARLVGASPVRKLAWQLAFPLLQLARTARTSVRGRGPDRRWLAANIAVQLGADVALAWLLGPWALVYLLASTLFGAALHPISARYVQEHFALGGPGASATQETFSYYGPGNRVALNLGYHNEHHDFPFVAWHRLPAVRRAAPEVYDRLVSHRSWTRLWWRFLTDREITLFRRVVRERRGG